jgi:hypothetical protein
VSFVDKPTLVGARVTLRPVRVGDAEELSKVDEETLRLTGTHKKHGLDSAS